MIRSAQLTDVPNYYEHLLRHGRESGRDGDPIFAPYEEPWAWSLEDLQKKCSERWHRPITEVGWERCWLLFDDDGRTVRGELKLAQQPPLKTALHHATIAMAIERSHRRQGWGSKLIDAATDWARPQPTLDWLQLYVFAGNNPARALYRKKGFVEIGITPDLFRVHGQSIDDITMVLKLREPAPIPAPGLRIREATERDVPVILDFIRRLAEFEKLSHEVVATEDSLHATLFGAKRHAEVLLAELDGRAVGFALFFHNYSTFLGKPGLYLEDLFVLPEARGHGIGRRLLEHLARIARERGCGRFEWWVLDWNENAIEFYRRLGAVAMSEWTVYRMTGKALEELAGD